MEYLYGGTQLDLHKLRQTEVKTGATTTPILTTLGGGSTVAKVHCWHKRKMRTRSDGPSPRRNAAIKKIGLWTKESRTYSTQISVYFCSVGRKFTGECYAAFFFGARLPFLTTLYFSRGICVCPSTLPKGLPRGLGGDDGVPICRIIL